MKTFSRLMLIGVVVVCQSCATQKLWDDTNPRARIWIDADKTTEAALRSRGVTYEVYDTGRGKGYLIEKSGWQKMKDYQLRALGTPVTLALDATKTVVVVGVYVFMNDPYHTISLIEAICK
jgi:hypothetical protein